MIILTRRALFFFFALLSIALAPFVFILFAPLPISRELVPVIIAAEAMIYVLFTMIGNTRAGWDTAVGVAALLAILRAALNLPGAMILAATPQWPGTFESAWINLHVCNPLSLLLQMLLLLLLAPYLLRGVFPRLLTPEAAAAILDPPRPAIMEAPAREHGGLSSPAGGFVQVFSYQELTESMRKIAGLKGFLIYDSEGLPVWAQFDMDLSANAAAAYSNQALAEARAWIERLYLRDLEMALVTVSGLILCNLMITRHERLLLLFSRDVSIRETMTRIERARLMISELLRLRSSMDG
ncbi:MAG: hypothetical protein NTW86_30550 [Candidatus Sumerlaeota bacterium]|nr:hypothetical protein [Candidatus Sumerlaeota bacterium]